MLAARAHVLATIMQNRYCGLSPAYAQPPARRGDTRWSPVRACTART